MFSFRQNMASSEDNNGNRAYGNLPQDLRLDSSRLPVLVRSQLILPKIFDFPSDFERLLPFFTKFDDINGLYYYICLIMLFFVYICSHSWRMEMMDPPFWGHKLIWTPIQIFWGMLIFICSNDLWFSFMYMHTRLLPQSFFYLF